MPKVSIFTCRTRHGVTPDQTRSGKKSSPFDDLEFTTQIALQDLDIIYTGADFSKLVEASFDAEARRVFDQDDEDDVDGWELETREEEETYSPSGSPLSSPATSRAPFSVPAPSAEPGSSRKRPRRGKRNPDNKPAPSRVERSKIGAKRKKEMSESMDPRDYKPSAHALQKINELTVIPTEFNAANLHAAKSGWIGKRRPVEGAHPKLAAALAAGHRLVEWNGLYVVRLSPCEEN